MPDYAKQRFGNLADEYLRLYPANNDQQAAESELAFRSNRGMADMRRLARWQVKTGKAPVYWYLFTHVSPFPQGLMWGGEPANEWGAYHGSEIVYVFGTFPFQQWPWRTVDLNLGDVVSSLWINFAKTGDPNGGKLVKWPRFDATARAYLDFTDAGPVAKESLRRQACDVFMENQKRQAQ